MNNEEPSPNIMGTSNKPNSPGNKKEIEERRQHLYDEFISNVTMHGFPYIFKEIGIRRWLWVIIMLSALIIAIFLFKELLVNYPTQSMIEYTIRKNVDVLPFPSVTICNMRNPLHKIGAHREFPINITKKQFRSFYNSIISGYSEEESVDNNYTKYILESLRKKNYSSYEKILKLFELNKNYIKDETASSVFFNNCQFDEEECDISTDIKDTLHWAYSLCQQYNYYQYNKKSKETRRFGFPSGLMMSINLESERFAHKFTNDYELQALAIILHPYGTPHYISKYTDIIYAQPGSLTNIELGLIEVSH